MATRTYDSLDFDGKYGATDFTIECQQEASNDVHIFRIHKAAVQGQSPYLDMLLTGGFRETEENRAKMQEEVAVVATILWHTYGYDLDEFNPPTALNGWAPVTVEFQRQGLLLAQLKIYQKADAWDIPELQMSTKRRIRREISDLVFDLSSQGANVSSKRALMQSVLMYVCAGMPYPSELPELFAYFCHRSLSKSENETLAEAVPSFARYQRQEEEERSRKEDWYCECCHKIKHKLQSVVLFAKSGGGGGGGTEDADFQVVCCACNFRGFCSDNCKAGGTSPPYRSKSIIIKTWPCCETCSLTHGKRVHCKTEQRLGELRPGSRDYVLWSHSCRGDDNEVNWLNDRTTSCNTCGAQVFRVPDPEAMRRRDREDLHRAEVAKAQRVFTMPSR